MGNMADKKLPPLDVLITRKEKWNFGFNRHKKPTHTNTWCTMNGLILRIISMCDMESIFKKV